jgi:beta-N-acetylhexosaminidase
MVNQGRRRAAIIGLGGSALSADEASMLRDTPPLGVILFARNIAGPAALRALTAAIRETLGEATPILIDQEGGRVARLRPPDWPVFPPAASFEGRPAQNAYANAALIGLECAGLGLNVVCAPVLDLRLPEGHGIIGDRAFSADPAEVSRLGREYILGLQAAGCIPVIKHIPGHGRALADSHLELPRVSATREDLALDCAPFAALAALGAWAMTAHILYESLDVELPATLSPRVIARVIRGAIGFDGFLVSDDLAMKALIGQPAALAQASISAGCDAVLHCTGELAETAALLADCPLLSDAAMERLDAARAATLNRHEVLDPAALTVMRYAAMVRSA